MEDLTKFLRNDIFKAFEGLSTFEAFTKQAAHLIYEEMHAKMSDENIEFPIDTISATFFPPELYDHDKMSEALFKISKRKKQKTVKPEFDIKVKPSERVRNPKTNRMIYKGGDLFNSLVDQGWLDKNGIALKEHNVRRLKNPKTGKLVTFRDKRFNMMVEEGWFDAKGNILKVRHPTTQSPLSVKDTAFKEFVSEGVFNPDGTKVEKGK